MNVVREFPRLNLPVVRGNQDYPVDIHFGFILIPHLSCPKPLTLAAESAAH